MKTGTLSTIAAAVVVACASTARAQQEPAPARVELPQKHEYQRVLRQYLATLTEADFAHGVTGHLRRVESSPDPEYQYRNHLFTMMLQPMVGTKRGAPSVNAPAYLFTLSTIEGTNAVMRPPVWPESLIAFERWDYPGNPFHNNRALRLRAFVAAAVNMIMLDDYLDREPTACRSDRTGYHLVYAAVPYLGSRDEVPPEAQKAFEDGLKRMGRRILEWGPKGEEPNQDLTAAVGLWYASQAVRDPEFTKEAEAYARRLLADPGRFNPAGYHVERGGLDLGFGGMANFFTVWLALASEWPFARDAVARTYRLRAHLCLPEPWGTFTGPSHFNARLGTPACADQWDWNFRDYAAAMVTDEAACLTKMPSNTTLEAAAATRAGMFNHALEETQGVRFKGATTSDFVRLLHSGPWRYHMWSTLSFPASVNFGYEFYPKGAFAHRLQLETNASPFLKSPYLRNDVFVRNFSNAFFAARQPAYAAILHTGPVGAQDPADGLFQFAGPLGFGGGQLSAFWTPAAGAVILGRRAGMSWDACSDKPEQWRIWPIHAVSGCTADGAVFTSARIVRPDVAAEIGKDGGSVRVSGVITNGALAQTNELRGTIEYARAFTIAPQSVRVETRVKALGQDRMAELYETIPVYLGEGRIQRTNANVSVQFQSGGAWAPADSNFVDRVTAVRITRCAGAVRITFDQPCRAQLAPEWRDTYLTQAACRNIQVDLLGRSDKPAPLEGAAVSYTIAPDTK